MTLIVLQLITSNQTPSPTLLSALSLVVRWDVNNCDRKRRIDHSYINEFYHHPQASLSFVVLPSFIENNNGVISMRKTPLSEAVRVHSFLWSEFLVKVTISFHILESPSCSYAEKKEQRYRKI